MARMFNGSDQYLEVDSAVQTAYPMGMACWLLATSTTAQIAVCICNSGNNFPVRGLQVTTSGLNATERGNNGSFGDAFSEVPLVDTWTHGAALFRGLSYRKAYTNGTAGTANTTTVVTGTFNRTDVGRWGRPSDIRYFGGRLAEVAVWNLIGWGSNNTDRELAFDRAVAAMAAGQRPIRFPIGLVGYWPLWGDHSPEIDLHPRNNSASDYELTVIGAAKADHAPVHLYSRPQPLVELRNPPVRYRPAFAADATGYRPRAVTAGAGYRPARSGGITRC